MGSKLCNRKHAENELACATTQEALVVDSFFRMEQDTLQQMVRCLPVEQFANKQVALHAKERHVALSVAQLDAS